MVGFAFYCFLLLVSFVLYDYIWSKADDAYIVDKICTLQDLKMSDALRCAPEWITDVTEILS